MKEVLSKENNQLSMRLAALEKEESTLPRGSIRERKIRGGTYYYLQYREGGKVKSQYIKADELPELQKKVIRRKEIQVEIKDIKERQRILEKVTGFHHSYRPVKSVDYQDYTLFMSSVAHDYKRLGFEKFIQKYDVTKYRGINKRYLKGYLDFINGIDRGNSRRTNDLVLDPYTYLMYYKYGDKSVLERELSKAIPAFLNQGLLVTSVQEAVHGTFNH